MNATQVEEVSGVIIYPPRINPESTSAPPTQQQTLELTSQSSNNNSASDASFEIFISKSQSNLSSERNIITSPAEAKNDVDVFQDDDAVQYQDEVSTAAGLNGYEEPSSRSFDDSYLYGRCFGFIKSHVNAFVTFLKAMFGVSLLSSPHVIGETGLLLGTLAYVIIISACTFACYLILKARAAVEAALHARHNEQRHRDEKSLSRPSMIYQNNMLEKHDNNHTSTSITYGVLGKELLGPKASVLLVFLIVTLHVCFGAGMLAASSHQFAVGLGWQKDDRDFNQMPKPVDRLVRACMLFPFVAIVLNFRSRFELFLLCSAGLLIYLFGVVGSMVYATVILAYATASASNDDGDDNGSHDNNNNNNAPDDMWQWKWAGIPNFVASTVCAIEGINLALPTANTLSKNQQKLQRQRQQSRRHLHQGTAHARGNQHPDSVTMESTINAIPVVSAVIISYGILTLMIAWIGYLGGLGGGEGTPHGEDACEQISYCLDSNVLTKIHQLSLGVTLLLTLPIILYPSIEMLELWADEREVQLTTGRTSSDRSIASGWNGFVVGSAALRQSAEPQLFDYDDDYSNVYESMSTVTEAPHLLGRIRFPKHWRLRLGHAVSICILAVVKRSFESTFTLLKGLGLSFVGFMLPCIFFVCAQHKYHNAESGGGGRGGGDGIIKNRNSILSMGCGRISFPLKVALAGLVALGFFNFMLVYMSVFTDHNYMPEHELHHPHHEEENNGDDSVDE